MASKTSSIIYLGIALRKYDSILLKHLNIRLNLIFMQINSLNRRSMHLAIWFLPEMLKTLIYYHYIAG